MNLLILGGSSEASALVRAIAGESRFAPILSLAGRTRAPVLPQHVAARIGGFGGIAGLVAFLRMERIGAVVNATHPFAAGMSANAAAATAETSVPLLRILRPAWTPEPGDDWREVADMRQAARALGEAPRRVLLTIGRQDLAPFVAAPQHHYVIRSVDPPPPESLPPRATVISARGPFDAEAETALLRDHAIEVVVTKNAGGGATEAKLAAARARGLPVVMVARPPPAPGETVPDVAGALRWLDRVHAALRGV
ncbi:MAG TPA: cobalt-precorrin-6A reductase [Acetobacteraceae bacterium]|nr:cobalt-precorrin-6A reductase [Acetobacteraceae bacterium]